MSAETDRLLQQLRSTHKDQDSPPLNGFVEALNVITLVNQINPRLTAEMGMKMVILDGSSYIPVIVRCDGEVITSINVASNYTTDRKIPESAKATWTLDEVDEFIKKGLKRLLAKQQSSSHF